MSATSERRVTRQLLQVLLPAQFILSMGYGVLFALLAELQDAHGLPTAGLGLISGATFVTSLITQLVLSRYADRGHARTMMAAGLVASMLALLWFATADNLWEFVAARSIEGFGIGSFLPAARALVLNADPQRSGRNLGLISSFDLAGVTLGPLLGAILAGWFTLSTPFFVLAALTAAASVFVMTAVRRMQESPVEGGGRHTLRRLLRIRRVVGVAIITLALEFPVGIYDSLWARYLTDRGGSELFIGVSLFVFGLPFVVFATAGGRLADRYGPLRVALVGFFVIVPTTFAYGLATVPMVILAIGVVESIGMCFVLPGSQAAMAEASPPDLVASGQGLALAAGIGGAGVAAFVAAPVYQSFGPGWLFAGTAVLMAVLAVIGWRVAGPSDQIRERGPERAQREGAQPGRVGDHAVPAGESAPPAA